MPADTIENRDPKVLAEEFEKHMVQRGIRKMNLKCESEHEAVLVAHELRKRGWKAEPDQALQGAGRDLKVIEIVYVEKKRARKAGNNA